MVLGRTEIQSCAITVQESQLPISVQEFQKQYRELTLDRLRDVSTLRGTDSDLHFFFLFECLFEIPIFLPDQI